MVFHTSILGGLELRLGGLSPPKPPVATGLLNLTYLKKNKLFRGCFSFMILTKQFLL